MDAARSTITCAPRAGSTAEGALSCVEAPSTLRRLSRFEYFNTLRDLFPGVAFDDLIVTGDAAPFGYDNDAPRQTLADQSVFDYHEAARRIAARVAPTLGATCASLDLADCRRTFVAELGARIFRRENRQWPKPARPRSGIAIEFTAGFGEESSDVPSPIREALKLWLGFLYEHRDGDAAACEPATAATLLSPYREVRL